MTGRFSAENLERVRLLLCELEETIRDAVLRERRPGGMDFSEVVEQTMADTIYRVDKVSEEAILHWFRQRWPAEWPVLLVMEGMEERGPLTFPEGLSPDATVCTCIMDPIDGTRNIMYDKRSAWILAAVAPRSGSEPRSGEIAVAAMTELPPTKQRLGDQVSAVRGRGLRAERENLDDGKKSPLSLRPSQATDFRHGFASISRFFPEGKSLLATMEEELWDELYGLGSTASPLVFDDQYISTGGQVYELLAGHDRMIADLRPLALEKLGFHNSLVCHPYDFCTALLLEEAGVVVEHPRGGSIDLPLDTVSPVAWIAFANHVLADQVRPIMHRLIEKHF